jgi:hypothetical protein
MGRSLTGGSRRRTTANTGWQIWTKFRAVSVWVGRTKLPNFDSIIARATRRRRIAATPVNIAAQIPSPGDEVFLGSLYSTNAQLKRAKAIPPHRQMGEPTRPPVPPLSVRPLIALVDGRFQQVDTVRVATRSALERAVDQELERSVGLPSKDDDVLSRAFLAVDRPGPHIDDEVARLP